MRHTSEPAQWLSGHESEAALALVQKEHKPRLERRVWVVVDRTVIA